MTITKTGGHAVVAKQDILASTSTPRVFIPELESIQNSKIIVRIRVRGCGPWYITADCLDDLAFVRLSVAH
eukprot:scaffold23061_cov37-Tisochrysis_lutea.AAC.2